MVQGRGEGERYRGGIRGEWYREGVKGSDTGEG